MNSRTTERFRKAFAKLAPDVQEQAREAYRRFLRDPRRPGLRFKRVHATRPIDSVRISQNYRALGVLDGESMTWFWIGSHDEYDQLLGQL